MKPLLTCALLIASLCYGQGSTPVGLLSSVKGPVQLQRAGQTTPVPARTADLIGAGDRLLTAAGGEAIFLYCPDARSARLPASGEVFFSPTAMQVRKGKLADERKVAGCRLPATLALSGASQQQVGLTRTRNLNDLNLRTPSRTFIADNQPHFRWNAIDNAKGYEVRVTDREERVLYKATVSSTQLDYPSDAPPLAPGQKYWWRVVARDANEPLAEAATFFQTLPESQAKEFKAAEADLRKQMAANPADNGPRFLLAFLYEENGLLGPAARTYDDLAKRLGENEWLKYRLVTILNKLGWDKAEPE